MRTLNSALAVCILVTGLASCKNSKTTSPDQGAANTNALAATYGAKNIYIWNRRILNKDDNIWRSCWYYKEALPKDGLSERQAMYESVSLNKFSLHDDHVKNALQEQVQKHLKQSGIEFIPCALSAAGFGVSVASAIGSVGLATLGAFLTGATTVDLCIDKASKIDPLIKKSAGSGDAITSIQNGETGMGKKIAAQKIEVDMLREAITTAISLGYEAKPECPEPKEFKDEIMSKGMGD